MTKEYTLDKEGVYVAFPLAMGEPRFRYATQNGWVDPERDLLPGASLEWHTAHQWVEVADAESAWAWTPVDAPLFAIGDIVRGSWPRSFGRRPAALFSYVMNNYTPEGYQAGQGGDFVFRYHLSSARSGDPARWHRLGMEALTPLEVNEVTRNDKVVPRSGWLPAGQASFLQIDCPHVSLMAWKPAERGEGTILRLLETAGRSAPATLGFPLHRVVTAHRCSAVEDELEKLKLDREGVLKVEVPAHGIVTLKVRLNRKR